MERIVCVRPTVKSCIVLYSFHCEGAHLSSPVLSDIVIMLVFLLLAPSREAPCGRMCPPLPPLPFVDYGTTL